MFFFNVETWNGLYLIDNLLLLNKNLSVEEFLGNTDLFVELFGSLVHGGPGEFINLQILDNGHLAISNGNGERVDNIFLDAIVTTGSNGHRDPLSLGSSKVPVTDVVGDGVGGRESRRELTGSDDGSSSLLDNLHELGLVPLVLSGLLQVLLLTTLDDVTVVGTRVLGGGVVTPDGNVLDVLGGDLELLGDLGLGTVVVETGKGREVLLGDGRSVQHGDTSVGVGGVANDQHLDGLLGELVQSLTLVLEDRAVLGQEVLPLHTLLTGEGTDKNGVVDVLEGGFQVGGTNNTINERVRAILELENNTLQSFLAERNIQKVKDDLLLGSKHVALGDQREESIANLTSSSSNQNTNGGSHNLSKFVFQKEGKLKNERTRE